MIYLLGLVTGAALVAAVPFFAFVLSTPTTAVRALARAERRFLRASGWRGRGETWTVPARYPFRVKYVSGYTRRHAVNAQILALYEVRR